MTEAEVAFNADGEIGDLELRSTLEESQEVYPILAICIRSEILPGGTTVGLVRRSALAVLEVYDEVELMGGSIGRPPALAPFKRPREVGMQCQASSSSSALASFRSGVSKPSVNQVWTGARRSRALERLPWSRHDRARSVVARSSHHLAPCR